MKKSLLAVAVMSLFLAACGGEKAPAEASAPAVASEVQAAASEVKEAASEVKAAASEVKAAVSEASAAQ